MHADVFALLPLFIFESQYRFRWFIGTIRATRDRSFIQSSLTVSVIENFTHTTIAPPSTECPVLTVLDELPTQSATDNNIKNTIIVLL